MLIKIFTATIIFALSTGRVYSQDTVTLSPGSYQLKETGKAPVQVQAVSQPGNIVLQQGLYQSIDRYTHTVFNVNNAGFLQGEKKIFSVTRLQEVSQWNNGKFVRGYKYNYDNGRLMEESFDSAVAVFLYDSTANHWDSTMLTVRVRKEYSMVRGGEGDWLLVFSKTTGNAYALCQFTKGKMVSRNYPYVLHEMYNGQGEVSFREVHNWKLKQIETTSFTDTATWKNIATDKNIRWNSDGTISYLAIGDAGEDIQRVLYKSGKIVTREVFKNNTKTVTEYDGKGKVKSKQTYRLPKVKNEIQGPV